MGGNLSGSACFFLNNHHLASLTLIIDVLSTYNWQTICSRAASVVDCEQSSFFPQITRAKAPTKLCKLEKRTRRDCGFLVRSINRALRSIYRALQKLGKERDCSQSTSVASVGFSLVPRSARAVIISGPASRNVFPQACFPFPAKLPVLSAPVIAWNPGKATYVQVCTQMRKLEILRKIARERKRTLVHDKSRDF